MNTFLKLRTTAVFGSIVLTLTMVSTGVFAGEQEMQSDDALQPVAAAMLLNEKREFDYPPGYMDRSPAQHRPVVQKYCVECDMDFSQTEKFQDRAAVVNFFKLSTTDAIGLDKGEQTNPHKQQAIEKPKTKEKLLGWLQFRSL